MREDAEVVVLRGPDGKMMYAPKTLHITEVRVTPPNANQTADWAGSRFTAGHIRYTIAAKSRPESVARLSQLVGPGTPAATVTLDANTAAVDTAILPVATNKSANADGSTNVELVDTPSTGATALSAAALRRALVTGAHASATIACGPNSIPIALSTTGGVIFDTDVAKVLSPANDLSALDTFLATASSIRSNAFKDPLSQVNNPDLDAKMAAFADVVDREIKPVIQAYGGTMSRAEVKTRVQNAWNAYRDLSAAVLAATKDASDLDHLQSKNADGSYSFASGTSTLATQLLPSANELRSDVDKMMADGGDGWTIKHLE
jgi:hypothetical protein